MYKSRAALKIVVPHSEKSMQDYIESGCVPNPELVEFWTTTQEETEYLLEKNKGPMRLMCQHRGLLYCEDAEIIYNDDKEGLLRSLVFLSTHFSTDLRNNPTLQRLVRMIEKAIESNTFVEILLTNVNW